MSTESNSTQFWMIVQACLEELYGFPCDVASKQVQRLAGRRKQGRSLGGPKDMTYHSQPLHVASNIAGEDEPMPDSTWTAYQAILARFEAAANAPHPKHKESGWSHAHSDEAFASR